MSSTIPLSRSTTAHKRNMSTVRFKFSKLFNHNLTIRGDRFRVFAVRFKASLSLEENEPFGVVTTRATRLHRGRLNFAMTSDSIFSEFIIERKAGNFLLSQF